MTTFIANFKKVSNKAHPYFGKKRDAITITYADIAPESLTADHVSLLANNAMQDFAKRLIAEHADDWDYSPTPDMLTVATLFADLTAPSARGNRVFTSVNIAAFAALYHTAMVQELNKTDAQGKTGADILRAKFTPVMSNPKVMDGMLTNLGLVAETAMFQAAMLENPIHEAVLGKFVELITEIQDAHNAPELDSDSI